MRTFLSILCVCLLALPAGAFPAEKGLTVKGVRHFSYAGFTRVVFEIEAAAPYVLARSEDGKSLTFTAYDGAFALKTALPSVNDGVVNRLELKQEAGRSVIFITLGGAAGETKDFVLRNPDRIVLDVMRGASVPQVPSASAVKSTVIVLDAGHGGPDAGIITAQGQEKAMMLDLALAVKKMLRKNNPAFTVLLTREKDQGMSLEDRAAAANGAEAMLFVSMHAAPGAEARVFILDPDEGQIVPPRGARGDFLGFDAVNEQQQMLWGAQQAAHAKESGSLGRKIARLFGGKDGAEPGQAPLAILKAVDAAAVMVEIGAGQDRAQAAETLAKGIEQYVREKR